MTTTFTRPLGNSGIQVSALGLGCWAIGGDAWGKVDDNESIRAIHRGIELGVNFVDTADVYGKGHSEEVLAKALEGQRDQIVIATKFGYGFPKGEKGPTEANIRYSLEGSLKRLNTDYIDLYQLHINDYDPNKAAPVRDILEKLVTEGKIRTYGWSTDFPAGIPIFAEGAYCVAVQKELNVVDDAPEVIALCEKLNLAILNRGPLAMGLLTGKYPAGTTMPNDDVRGVKAPSWMKYFKDGKPNPEWQDKVTAVREILVSGGRTLAQGALAWLWGRSALTLPIPGFKTVAQVEDNCGALEKGPLTPDQMNEIASILGRELSAKPV
jgi:aryl-alcohol dehydrogenase-like predicted oxidoreductase